MVSYAQSDRNVTLYGQRCRLHVVGQQVASDISVIVDYVLNLTSLHKVIWEQGRVAAAVPGAGWHKGLRIRKVCIVFVKDTCVRKRAVFSVRKQE